MRKRTLRSFGFTLVELMIVVALVVIVLTLAAPSFRDMIEMQRLKSVNAQVVTDVQFARSEAATRQRRMYLSFTPDGASGLTCYVIHTCEDGVNCQCECHQPAGSRCTGSRVEVRTVQIPTSLGVRVSLTAPPSSAVPNLLYFDPATGGITSFSISPGRVNQLGPGEAWVETSLTRSGDTLPKLRAVIATTGRPSVCAGAGSVSGVPAC
jgi:type IV fimbrial biogenesis protein FimT